MKEGVVYFPTSPLADCIKLKVSNIREEVLKNSNRWELLDIRICRMRKELSLTIDGYSAPGLGEREPPESVFINMEEDYAIKFRSYSENLAGELETELKLKRSLWIRLKEFF